SVTPSEPVAPSQPDTAPQESSSATAQPSGSAAITPTSAGTSADSTAAKSANESATVQFESTPTGASVQIDGRSDPAWITPFSVSELQAGSHKLVFAKPGYLADAREIEVSAGKSTYSIALTALGATLNIASDPKGALIMLDGTETGKTTPAEIKVQSGEHSIGLNLEK